MVRTLSAHFGATIVAMLVFLATPGTAKAENLAVDCGAGQNINTVLGTFANRNVVNNLTISGGPAPVRAYIEELLRDVLDGKIEPGQVFDQTVGLDGVPAGYRSLKA